MKKLEKQIVDFFKEVPHIACLILFGSYAKNQATEKSDVDLAILWENGRSPDTETLIYLREDFSSRIGKEIDLVSLNGSSPILEMQVYNHGKILLLNKSKEFAEYQMRLFSDYAELKELRAPMEKEILKRKFYD